MFSSQVVKSSNLSYFSLIDQKILLIISLVCLIIYIFYKHTNELFFFSFCKIKNIILVLNIQGSTYAYQNSSNCNAKEISFYYFRDTKLCAKHECVCFFFFSLTLKLFTLVFPAFRLTREFHLYCWNHVFKVNEWCWLFPSQQAFSGCLE